MQFGNVMKTYMLFISNLFYNNFDSKIKPYSFNHNIW